MSNIATVLRQLVLERSEAKKNAAGWKAEFDRITEQMSQMLNPEYHLTNAGKMQSGGSTTIEENDVKFVVEAKKEVKWDSAKLQNIAARMPWEMVESIFKIAFEITETSYKNCLNNTKSGMLDAQIMALIDDARTVQIGEAKIKTAEIII